MRADADFAAPFGLFSRQRIQALIARGAIAGRPRRSRRRNIQPASLDLRLGKEAYPLRASFLPGTRPTPSPERLESLDARALRRSSRRRRRAGKGHRLYRAAAWSGSTLPPSLSGAANPKSSTGRLDIFTRLIVDGSEAFDDVPLGYRRPL